MKKWIAALLALIMLMYCASALAEGAPMIFEEAGIRMDCEDVLKSFPYYAELVETGIVSRDPYIACVYLEFFALDRETMNALLDNFNTYSEEKKNDIRQFVNGIHTNLAFAIATEIQDPDEMVRMLFGVLPEGAEVLEFGTVEPYHYYAVTMPGMEPPKDYEAYRALDMDPEQVREAHKTLRADSEAMRDAFVECLKAAELAAPAEANTGLVGQVLSFETTDIDGNVVKSADLFKDNRITMVNVWGIWCHFCVEEMAELAEIHTRIQEKGCGVVGVEWEQRPIETMKDEIHAFLEEKGTNYPNVIMPQGNAILDQITGYPTTYFVDSEGRILTMPIVGALVDQYEATVYQLLADAEAAADAKAGAVKNDSGEYHVIVCDMDGNPVEGAVIQLCDDATCAFQPTDAEGVAAFSVEEGKVYEVHVLVTPEGYAPDENLYYTLDTFSDVRITLEKAA